MQLTGAMIRMLFAGGFALVSLIGAISMELCGNDAPEWLIITVAAAVGYIFGHAQENGLIRQRNGKRSSSNT